MVYNTAGEAANAEVRAFFTVDEKYWGKMFNTGPGLGRAIWEKVKNEVFRGHCCYCGKQTGRLQIKHLIMFNCEEYGLYHPGNLALYCKEYIYLLLPDHEKHVIRVVTESLYQNIKTQIEKCFAFYAKPVGTFVEKIEDDSG